MRLAWLVCWCLCLWVCGCSLSLSSVYVRCWTQSLRRCCLMKVVKYIDRTVLRECGYEYVSVLDKMENLCDGTTVNYTTGNRNRSRLSAFLFAPHGDRTSDMLKSGRAFPNFNEFLVEVHLSEQMVMRSRLHNPQSSKTDKLSRHQEQLLPLSTAEWKTIYSNLVEAFESIPCQNVRCSNKLQRANFLPSVLPSTSPVATNVPQTECNSLYNSFHCLSEYDHLCGSLRLFSRNELLKTLRNQPWILYNYNAISVVSRTKVVRRNKRPLESSASTDKASTEPNQNILCSSSLSGGSAKYRDMESPSWSMGQRDYGKGSLRLDGSIVSDRTSNVCCEYVSHGDAADCVTFRAAPPPVLTIFERDDTIDKKKKTDKYMDGSWRDPITSPSSFHCEVNASQTSDHNCSDLLLSLLRRFVFVNKPCKCRIDVSPNITNTPASSGHHHHPHSVHVDQKDTSGASFSSPVRGVSPPCEIKPSPCSTEPPHDMNHRSASHVGTSDCAKEVNEQLSNDGRKLLSQRGESEKVGGHVEVAPNSMHAGELVVSDWYKKVYVDTGRVEDDRVRFCHQLDYATSGILVMGLSRRDAAACQQLFQERKAKKLYSAILFGHYFYQSTADDKGHENAQLPYCPRPSRGLPVSPTCDGDTTTSHAISALPTAERTAAHIFAGDNSSGPCGVEKLNDSPDAVQICTGIDYVCNLQNHCNELGRLSAPIAKQCCADVAIGTQKQRAAEETKEAGGEQHDIADDKYFFRMQRCAQ
eukprot:GHVQ01043100.1.p1 GENE.GHVQ01043100.1~~GHVQ01043100.1.p1  ORF type:complete len:755 (+),score=102.78 GHVQ01043100.1:222-2486(+)